MEYQLPELPYAKERMEVGAGGWDIGDNRARRFEIEISVVQRENNLSRNAKIEFEIVNCGIYRDTGICDRLVRSILAVDELEIDIRTC